MLIFCEKVLTLAKLTGLWYEKVYFLELNMCVYLGTKFQVSSIIPTSFRQGAILPLGTSKRTSKKPTQIRIKVQEISSVE